jgi:hypothetical protein
MTGVTSASTSLVISPSFGVSSKQTRQRSWSCRHEVCLFPFCAFQAISSTQLSSQSRVSVLLLYWFIRVKVCHHGILPSYSILFLVFLSFTQKKAYFYQKENWGGKRANMKRDVETLFGHRVIFCKAHPCYLFVKWALIWKLFKQNFALVTSLTFTFYKGLKCCTFFSERLHTRCSVSTSCPTNYECMYSIFLLYSRNCENITVLIT